jgi:hypothetical protein
LLFERQFKPANGTSIVLFKPWREAVRVVYMTARHKHTFTVHVDILAAYCTRWWLKLLTVLLAMLLLYLD